MPSVKESYINMQHSFSSRVIGAPGTHRRSYRTPLIASHCVWASASLLLSRPYSPIHRRRRPGARASSLPTTRKHRIYQRLYIGPSEPSPCRSPSSPHPYRPRPAPATSTTKPSRSACDAPSAFLVTTATSESIPSKKRHPYTSRAVSVQLRLRAEALSRRAAVPRAPAAIPRFHPAIAQLCAHRPPN